MSDTTQPDEANTAGQTDGTNEQPNKKRKKRQRLLRREQQAQNGPGAAPEVVVRPMATPARSKSRHWGILIFFLLMVPVPTAITGWYLFTRAADQYASTLGFTVRSENIANPVDLLGGLGNAIGTTGGNDSDVLYEYIRGQEMVRALDERLDLRSLYARHQDVDPLLTFDPEGTIEDLTSFWGRMLRVDYDTGTGLMELRVLAFDPDEAQLIAETVFDLASARINELSATAREDATRYAREDLDLAIERLKTAREALTAFRLANRIVDPSADIQGQVGLLTTLQAQLAEALIEFDLLSGTARDGDPRLAQAERRINVIEERIAEERAKFGADGTGPGGESYAAIIAEFENLTVDREFAETAYTAALAAFDGARAEADRQSLYLAAYIRPTLAEKSEFPQRGVLTGLVALFSFLLWAIASLVFYSIKDRR